MTNFLKKYWLIILILILAAFLRFYKLNSYPALNADEAAIGYNAYSLIQTGMDEHGNRWPIHFQSFNDYKPGLYFYLVLPFVKFIGLNEWAVRIPNAASGVLTVLVLYFLVKELKIGNSNGKDASSILKLEIIASFMLAISPWHIHFSRGGWEVNTATFFILSGFYFFIKSLNTPRFRTKLFELIISSVLLIASLYTYHAARVVVPLLGLSTLIIYRKIIFGNLKPYIIFAVVSVILLVPLARDLASPGTLYRVAGVGLFADPGPLNRINEQRGEHGSIDSLGAKLIHNKAVNYGLAFAKNWQSHFTGEFLFMTGDVIQRNRVPETGEMYIFDILFLALGFIAIASHQKSWSFILSWLLVAPVASALTFQSPNALRAGSMVIPLIVVSAYGLLKAVGWLGNQRLPFVKIGGFLILAAFVIWNFTRYEHMYWVHMSKEYPFSSQYGVKELVSYVSENQSKYKDIVITNRYDQPYILFLFYTKYDPQKFQFHHSLTSRDEFGFSTVSDFDKYHFGPVDFTSMRSNFPNSLIIGTPEEIPREANIVKKINGTNSYEYFEVVVN